MSQAKTDSSRWDNILGLIPGYDSSSDEFWFDKDAADRVCGFFEELLIHVKGIKARQPFLLEDWQKAILGNLFGWKRGDGSRRYREAFVLVPRKNGKALAIDTPIATLDGWTTMGEIAEGDYVFDDDGTPCQVIGVTDVMYGRKCYRVKFSDNSEIIADAEHQWYTETRKPENGKGVKTTEEIAQTLEVGNRSTHKERNHNIPVAGALKLCSLDLPIDPYVLGAWLGDGNSADGRITYHENDRQVIGEAVASGESLGSVYHDKRRHSTCTVTILGLKVRLRSLGVLCNKHIPQAYMRGSFMQRLALIQGLMDTDGYVSKAGQCEFTTTSTSLRDGFMELACTLGYKPTLKTATATCNGKDCGLKYRIQFWAFQGRSVFRLIRKKDRLKHLPDKPTRTNTRQIIAVEHVESVPVKCISVNSPSHLYLAGRNFIPTHNTAFAAGIALYGLLCDNEAGAEIYSAAADRDQAKLVFAWAKGFVLASDELRSRCKIYQNAIAAIDPDTGLETGNSYKPISAEASTKHGYNTHLVVVDELHAQPNRELVDVLETSTGSRLQPLVLHITTADYARQSICNEKYDYACKVRDGSITDNTFLPVIYEASREDDWTAEETWYKANPNLGVSIDIDYIRSKCQKAQDSPSFENTFKRLHLNIQTEQDVRWLNMERWNACTDTYAEEDLVGKECFVGLDMSSNTDITALVAVFPIDDKFVVVPKFWIPKDNAHMREKRDKVQYTVWARDGYITMTPGNVVDYSYIRKEVEHTFETYNVRGLAFDRWGFEALRQQIIGDGVHEDKLISFGQGYVSMSAPTKELEKLVLADQIIHNNNPVLKWMASNVTVESDAAGNLKPSKRKSTEKIDGIVATIMAIGQAITQPPETVSVYETRGVLTI